MNDIKPPHGVNTLPRLRVHTINGEPMFPLRDLLKATGHRPFFIRGSPLPLASVRRFLHRSDKPIAPALLERIEAAAREGLL